jgi:hypothetical protein
MRKRTREKREIRGLRDAKCCFDAGALRQIVFYGESLDRSWDPGTPFRDHSNAPKNAAGDRLTGEGGLVAMSQAGERQRAARITDTCSNSWGIGGCK